MQHYTGPLVEIPAALHQRVHVRAKLWGVRLIRPRLEPIQKYRSGDVRECGDSLGIDRSAMQTRQRLGQLGNHTVSEVIRDRCAWEVAQDGH